MRIAILLTSNDTSEWAMAFPNDGEKFIALLKPLRPDWDLKTVSVKDDEFPEGISDYDGYIITGSPASVHDGHPWIDRLLQTIRDIHDAEIPLVGVCFGHQAIALALGGSVGKNANGWVIGTERTHITANLPWMEPQMKVLSLYAAHKEQVTQLPDGAKVIGTAPTCEYAAFIIGDRIMTTEYHPEMTVEFMSTLLEEMRGTLDEATYERAKADFEAAAQGEIFGRWMVQFMETAES